MLADQVTEQFADADGYTASEAKEDGLSDRAYLNIGLVLSRDKWHPITYSEEQLLLAVFDQSFVTQLVNNQPYKKRCENLATILQSVSTPFHQVTTRLSHYASWQHYVEPSASEILSILKLVSKHHYLMDKHAPGITWTLGAITMTHREASVRKESLETLAQMSRFSRAKKARLLKLTTFVIQRENNNDTRRKAVRIIGDYRFNDTETLALLKELAINEPHYGVRLQAFETFVKIQPDKNESLALAKDRAVREKDYTTRVQAYITIKDLKDDSPETLSFLKGRAITDQENHGRIAAAEAYHELETDKETFYTFARDRGKNDPDPTFRIRMLRILRKEADLSDKTLTFLIDLAQTDPDKYVRAEAIQTLPKDSNAEILELLRKIMDEDPAAVVKRSALAAYVEREPDQERLEKLKETLDPKVFPTTKDPVRFYFSLHGPAPDP